MYEKSFSLLPEVDSEHQIHLNRYFKFILSRPIRKYKKKSGLVMHHICPVAFGVDKSCYTQKWNIIVLTFREHFIAHMILFYCGYLEMIHAFHIMTQKGSNTSKYIKLTSRQYSYVKQKYVESRIGHYVSKETKEKINKKIISLENKKIFISLKEASEYYNFNYTSICKVINDVTKTAGGFHWFFLKDYDSSKIYNLEYNFSKKIKCIETNEIFNSIAEAGRKHNINA